jgi:hypothetical protein
MATSIRDLLDAADAELRSAAGGGHNVEMASSAVRAIGVAARILAQLSRDGFAREPGNYREMATAELATACGHLADHAAGSAPGRPAELLAAASDAIGLLHNQTANEDRWALAITITNTVRRCTTTYERTGPELASEALKRVRNLSILVTQLGTEMPPDPRRLAIQDSPVPCVEAIAPRSPLAAAAENAQILTAALQRASRDTEPALFMCEIRAVAMAAESAARYGVAVAAAHHDDASGEQWSHTADIWLRTRQAAYVLHDGRTVNHDASTRLLQAAVGVDEGLVTAFGPADQVTQSVLRRLEPAYGTHLRTVVNQLPAIADLLHQQVNRMHGRIVARAPELPFQESRVAERLASAVVVAGGADFLDFTKSLRSSRTFSTLLAAHLNGLSEIPGENLQRYLAVTYQEADFSQAELRRGRVTASQARSHEPAVPAQSRGNGPPAR